MKMKIICAVVAVHAMRYTAAAESDLHFNPAFLNGESASVADLSWVNTGSALPPGEYNINVYINKNYAFTGNVIFAVDKSSGQEVTAACLTASQLDALGVDMAQAEGVSLPLAKQCYFLNTLFPGSSADYEPQTLTLNITVPQSRMRNLPRGYVSPENWEHGINAGWLNYVINGSNNTYKGENKTRDQQLFASLNSGINIGAWRLRDYTTWTKDTNELNHVQTWLQRDVPALGAQLYAGETYTSSQVFDSVGVRGLALKTDDNMLPASLSGYAPEVRGIARSNAIVTVRQNGNVIYQTSVSPGPFVLSDLYPTSSGGDLSVTIRENDGYETQFNVPFASVPNLVRSGQVKYALSAGKFQPVNNQDAPTFAQGELFYGWRYGLTFYGGAQLSERYRGVAAGIGQNLGSLGAYSLDVTHARSQLADDKRYTGDSVRLRYSKLLNDIGTRVNFYSLRYSTQGFYNLSDTAYKRMSGGRPEQVVEADGTVTTRYENLYDLRMSRKARNQLQLSQPMDEYGSLSLSWDQQTYWHTSKTTQGIQFAWNTTFRSASLGVSFQRSTSLYDDSKDNILALSLSIPFGDPKNSTRARFSTTQGKSAGTTYSGGVSGYVPGKDELYYSVNQRYNAQKQYGGDAALQYKDHRGQYNLGYSYGRDARNLSYGISGGAVLHEDGLTLSQPLGNTNILIKAPGASEVAVLNHRSIKTDSRGYAVIPYATPYRVNRVGLDATTAGNDVELDNAIISKTPTDGALVRATITTQQGAKAMFVLRQNGKELPFGTVVALADSEVSSIVGDGGSIYLSGLPLKGTLNAVWGKDNAARCSVRYQLNKQDFNARTGLYSLEGACQ
ncbi:fimbria/pilus outer membrane usher protein [Pantoea agglomerans]|uniref:fimbria/pilus outer membrane usher protein n=1 Tax=Enterobacter agglomerans TaxID=549 RepID=UPI0010BF72CE|nr:fimbria/pilus outer membrane usher protein [Pantoea agglomerans]MBD8143952.1 fimbrial biogenesis outer membrane usher protein [Pantoea agglomerans]MBD8181481.1 fimbrial biogenesis outer membrane usher protein [Pantoea agglomerans]MBD8221645.1 fimbrial biogenesis outer membrane usher protein [Pantoea agglomerans]TKJ57917.1 fimbrial biogenesis outer membrane usher protein [Pantoea agglomerans]TKK21373.1 fimbrial biogenesis outer membrane usher protein [Pantoea agglomerans]